MKKVFLILTILLAVLFIFPLTIGQFLPIEFIENHDKQYYYIYVFTFLAFAFLGFINRKMESNKQKKNSLKNGSLIIIVGLIYIPVISLIIIFIGFGSWKNENILYRNIDNNKKSINEQIYDVGAFGYGKRRTVVIIPLLKYLQIVKEINVKKIDKTQWKLVNEIGDLKY